MLTLRLAAPDTHFGHLAPDIAVAHNRSLTGGESVRSLGLPPL